MFRSRNMHGLCEWCCGISITIKDLNIWIETCYNEYKLLSNTHSQRQKSVFKRPIFLLIFKTQIPLKNYLLSYQVIFFNMSNHYSVLKKFMSGFNSFYVLIYKKYYSIFVNFAILYSWFVFYNFKYLHSFCGSVILLVAKVVISCPKWKHHMF